MGATCNYSVHYWKQAAEEAHDSNHKAPLLGDSNHKTPLLGSTEAAWAVATGDSFAKTCITATGPYDHTKTSMKQVHFRNPFVTCWQSDSGTASNNYCWSNSYYGVADFQLPFNAQCVPQGSQWKAVGWQFVNPHQTCGSPCDSMRKYTSWDI